MGPARSKWRIGLPWSGRREASSRGLRPTQRASFRRNPSFALVTQVPLLALA